MAEINLTGDIQVAIDGAGPAGRAPVLAYIDDEGVPSLSYRGSTIVQAPDRIALWSHQKDGPLVASISERPVVSLLYHSRDTPGAVYLSIRGQARVAPDQDDAVYEGMSQGERDHDRGGEGVAIVIEVDSVVGAASDGSPIDQRRA
jgi:hypothetical protein